MSKQKKKTRWKKRVTEDKKKYKQSKSDLIQMQNKGKEDPVPLQEPVDKQNIKTIELTTTTTTTDKNPECAGKSGSQTLPLDYHTRERLYLCSSNCYFLRSLGYSTLAL